MRRAAFVVAAALLVLRPLQAGPGWIYFAGRPPEGERQIWRVRPDGRQLERVTRSAAEKRRPAVSARGDRLAFSTSSGEIRLLDLPEGRERTLQTSRPGHMWDRPAFSPAGGLLAAVHFQAVPREEADLELLLPLPPRRPWISLPGLEFDPAFSPDGRRVAYACFLARVEGRVREDLRVLDVATGRAAEVLADGYDNHGPAWLGPDDLVFASNRDDDAELYRIHISTRKVVRLTRHPGFDGEPAVSPEGDRIVRVRADGGRTRLALTDGEGGQEQVLDLPLEEEREPAWGREGPAGPR